MMVFARLLLALTFGALTVPTAFAQPVRMLGRVETLGAEGFRIEWPMSGFEASFTGDKLNAVIEDGGNNWLNVEVDGVSRAVALSSGVHSYKLFTGKKGPHTIRVTRRTGAPAGATRFVSVEAEGLRPTQASARRILVIGDSISAGYGVEGKDQYCTFSHATQNAGLAWPALLAKAYRADLQVIAVDGRGAYRNWDGVGPAMPVLMQRTLPSAEASWGAKFAAQLVIVHLGTNDFGQGDPGPQFRSSYLALLEKLRAEQPDAVIIATIGGMLMPGQLASLRQTLTDVVAARRAAGDRKTAFVYLDPPAGGRRYGCDWHPGRDAQRDMAQTLQGAIKQSLGWQAVAVN